MPVFRAETVAVLTMLPMNVPLLPATFVILRPTPFGAAIAPLLAMLPVKVAPLAVAMLETMIAPAAAEVAVTAPLLVMFPENAAAPTSTILTPVFRAETVAALKMLPMNVPLLPATFVILRPTPFGAAIVPLLAMLPVKVAPLAVAMLETMIAPAAAEVAVTAPLLVMFPENAAAPTLTILTPVFRAETVAALTML